jgi:hypothetical protein
MRGYLELLGLLAVIIVLAAFVVICIISASVLAVDRANTLDGMDVLDSGDDESGQGVYSCAALQASVCH